MMRPIHRRPRLDSEKRFIPLSAAPGTSPRPPLGRSSSRSRAEDRVRGEGCAEMMQAPVIGEVGEAEGRVMPMQAVAALTTAESIIRIQLVLPFFGGAELAGLAAYLERELAARRLPLRRSGESAPGMRRSSVPPTRAGGPSPGSAREDSRSSSAAPRRKGGSPSGPGASPPRTSASLHRRPGS